MIIDIHTHCFPDKLARKAVPLLAQRAGIPAYTDGTLTGLKKSMHNAEISTCVLQPIATKPSQTVSINRWAAGIQDERVISFGTIHPDYPHWKDEIKWLVSTGIKGVKFHPDYQDYFVDDERVFPIYEAIFKQEMIVLFHAGIDVGLPTPCHCTPKRLKNVLDRFHGSCIIAAHMGGYKCWDEVRKLLLGKDIYFDTSYSLKDLGLPTMEKMIKEHGVEKILFGSDSPWTDQSNEIQQIKSMNLTGTEIDLILGDNAKQLLRLFPSRNQ